MLEITVLVLFPALMAYAAASDLLTMTISNRVSIALVAGFVAVALASGMPSVTLIENHLACGLAVLVLTFTLFAFGWIGGGDAKLAASVLGAGLTFGILALRKMDLPAPLSGQVWIARLHSAGNGVPYGIALAVAGLALYPDTAAWTSLAAT